jgi:hypothetical protein
MTTPTSGNLSSSSSSSSLARPTTTCNSACNENN